MILLAFAIETPHRAGMMFRMNATPVREWLTASGITSQFPKTFWFRGFLPTWVN
jgi:hypothetical protein